MSTEELIVTLASGAAVLVMVLIAFALGFRARARITDEAHLAALIREAEPNAEIVHLARDSAGAAGIAQLRDGRWAAVSALGDRYAVRVFAQAELAPRRARGPVRVRFGDAGFPALNLRFDAPAPDWLVKGEA